MTDSAVNRLRSGAGSSTSTSAVRAARILETNNDGDDDDLDMNFMRAHSRSSSLFILSQSQRSFSDSITASRSEVNWVPLFSTVSLVVVFVVSISAVALCFTLAEFYYNQTEFPLAFVLLLARQLTLVSCVVTFLVGRNKFGKAYKLYQPFRGGDEYVVMQIIGIFLVVFSIVLCSFYHALSPSAQRYSGVFAVCGAAAVAGNLVLLFSVRRFIPESGENTTGDAKDTAASGKSLRRHRGVSAVLASGSNAPTAIVAAMLLGQIVLALLCIAFSSVSVTELGTLLGIQVLCGLLIHFWIGCKHTEGYQIFMLQLQRWSDTAAFVFLWILYMASLGLSTLSLLHHSEVTPLGFASLVAVNVTVGVLLLLMIRTTSFAHSHAPSPSTLMEFGGVASIAIATVLGFSVIGGILFLQSHEEQLATRQPLFEGLNWSNRDAIVFLLYCGEVMLLFMTPVVYQGCCMASGCGFRSMRRGAENLPVVVLHGVSWLCYILSILLGMLFIFTQLFFSGALSVLMSIVSVTCMTFAARVYTQSAQAAKTSAGSDATAAPPKAQTASPGAADDKPSEMLPQQRPKEQQQRQQQQQQDRKSDDEILFGEQLVYVVNNEMMFAYILSIASLLIRVVMDAATHKWWGDIEVPIKHLLVIANLCYAVSVPLAHISGHDKGIRVFSPFSGSPHFVAFQVLGWSAYAVLLITVTVSTVFVFINPTAAWRYMQTLSARYPSILIGVLEFVPLVIITLSVMIESHVTLSLRQQYVLAHESFLHLRALAMSYYARARDDEERAATQLAFRTLLAPSLEYYRIPHTANDFRLRRRKTRKGASAPAAPPLSDAPGSATAAPAAGSSSSGAPTRKAVRLTPPPPKTLGFLGSRSGSSDSDDESESEEDSYETREARRRLSHAARLIMVLACCASATFYILSAFFSNVHTLSLVFATCGLVVCMMTCMTLHAGYGVLYHQNSGDYSPFMPFRGGSDFVFRQVAGWSCFALLLVISITAAVEQSVVSPLVMGCGSFFSVLSPICIYDSVPYFTHSPDVPSFLEENGEGVVAVLAFAGAVIFSRLYDLVRAAVVPQGDASDLLRSFTTMQRIRAASTQRGVPFVISSIATGLAVPCVLIMLSRTTRQWRHAAARHMSPSSRRRRSVREANDAVDASVTVWAVLRSIVEVVALLCGALVPPLLAYAFYAVASNYTTVVPASVEYALPIALYSTVALLGLSIVPYVARVGMPGFVLGVRYAVVASSLYGMPLIAGVCLFGPMLVYPCYGTYFLAFMSLAMTLVGGYKQGRLVVRMSLVAWIGLSCYDLYRRTSANGVRYLTRRDTVFNVAVDAFLYALLAWYMQLYEGRPDLTGTQRSQGFVDFAGKYLFSNLMSYFRFSIIIDDPTVQMRDGNTQFLFGFHPHGVFPGTALYCTCTQEWREKVGTNPARQVVLHVASIIFNVPLIRDFNLRLGSRSVARKTIEHNLASGNSSLIVVGGQAEMLHTEISDTNMTIITNHHGFVRLAITHRVPLVPLLSFGEPNIFGLFTIKRIRRQTLKWLGFPFPMIPYGRFYLPIPRRTRLTLVVGKPLQIPADARADNPEDVERIAAMYFKEVRELFYRHRADAGFPEMELTLLDEKKKKKIE